MKNKWIVSLVLLVMIASVIYLVRGFDSSDELKNTAPTKPASTDIKRQLTESADLNQRVKLIAADLVKRYGARITQVVTQAELLGVLDQLQQQFGEQEGRRLFESAVRLAFAEQAQQIFKLIDRLTQYERWLDNNAAKLNRLSGVDRLAMLWQKRDEMFGEDAQLLFADSIIGSESKQLQVQSEMERLSQVRGQPADQIAADLLDQIDSIYSGTIEGVMLKPSDLSQAIFALDSVQESLAQLPRSTRQAQIDNLRRQAGLSEEAIRQSAQRDQINQQKWDTGYAYMAERQSLVQQFEAQDQARELSALRERTFGRSASTIANEEAKGFFRFERTRQYGVN